MKIHFHPQRLPIMTTRRLVLRDIRVKDISSDYVDWLNNHSVNRYLGVRLFKQTHKKVREYVEGKLSDNENTKHFGVYDQNGERLVGTVTIPMINWHDSTANLSFVIGHPSVQGKGYATEAVHALVYYMFRECSLHKLWAGLYGGHQTSLRVLEKNGFTIEGRMKGQLVDYRHKRVDYILMGLLASDYSPKEEWLGSLPPEAEGERPQKKHQMESYSSRVIP